MKKTFTNIVFALILLAGVAIGGVKASAEDALPISVSDINYEDLTMKVYKNGNSCVYFTTSVSSSIELSDWDEVSGESVTDAKGDYILMDISWASSAAETKFNLRGDKNTTSVQVKLPKQSTAFKVKFDKVSGDFDFTGQEEREFFYYRKSTDYNWTKVTFDGFTAADAKSYTEFLADVELLRFKGAKLVFKLGQVVGMTTDDSEDFGERPGKEVSVSISKYASAPSVKLNVTKLTFNTKATMEWTDDVAGTSWNICTKNMELEDIAPEATYEISASTKDVRLFFRTAQTEKKPCSQIMVVEIPAQNAKPTAGIAGSEDVVYAYYDDYMTLTFTKATKDTAYEYCIQSASSKTAFDVHTAKWKTVKNTKAIKLKEKVIDGATIYVRVKGTAAVASKGTAMVLPSYYESFDVNFGG